MLIGAILVVQLVELFRALAGRRVAARAVADDRHAAPGDDRLDHRVPAAAAVDADPRQRRRPAVHPRPHRRLRRRPDPPARDRAPPARSARWSCSLAVAGIVIGCIRRPKLDIPLAAVAAVQRGDRQHALPDGRPLLLPGPAVGPVLRRPGDHRPGPAGPRSAEVRRVAPAIAAVPLLYLVGVHAAVLPGDIGDARDFDRAGRQQIGPTDPATIPIYEAVAKYTEPDAVDRLLPGPHDVAAHGPPVVPDDEPAAHRASAPTTSPSSASPTTSSPPPRGRAGGGRARRGVVERAVDPVAAPRPPADPGGAGAAAAAVPEAPGRKHCRWVTEATDSLRAVEMRAGPADESRDALHDDTAHPSVADAHGQHVRQVRIDEPHRAAHDAWLHAAPSTTCSPASRPARSSRSASARATSCRRVRERFPGVPLVGARPARRGAQRGVEASRACRACSATPPRCPSPTTRSTSCSPSRCSSTSPAREAALAELARVCSGTFVASVPFEPIWRAGNLARAPLRQGPRQHARPRQPLDPLGLPASSSSRRSTSSRPAARSPGP